MSGSDRPLADRVIAVTRALRQSRDMMAAIRAAGGRAWLYPLIEVEWMELDRLRELAATQPDAFVFTSENGVDALAKALGGDALVGAMHPAGRAYCVGRATARRAAELGLVAVAPPAPHTAERLAEFLCAALPAGTRLVWPRGNLADPAWHAPLVAAGIDVSGAVVYETRTGAHAARLAQDVRGGRVDAVTFASASAASAFAAAWRELTPPEPPVTPLFAIGSRTGEALVRSGLSVAAYAREATAAALVEAVVAYYTEHPS